jgi:dihydrofolate reductase
MRKLIASTFVSLDGFMVGPNEDMSWVMNNFNDEMGKYAGDLQASMEAVLLGRVTYEIMTKAWPDRTEATSPGADRMNTVPKIVFSKSLDHLSEEIVKMKKLPGASMVIYGSASIVQAFTQLGLIDEYQVLVHPVLLGGGKRLFKDLPKAVNLKLLRTENFKNGVTVLYYAPAKN